MTPREYGLFAQGRFRKARAAARYQKRLVRYGEILARLPRLPPEEQEADMARTAGANEMQRQLLDGLRAYNNVVAIRGKEWTEPLLK